MPSPSIDLTIHLTALDTTFFESGDGVSPMITPQSK